MQEKKLRRSNSERTANTRAALVHAAHELFVTQGFAETSTPRIVQAADVTRGALYHHFADKTALFVAVANDAAAAVAEEIRRQSDKQSDALAGLLTGADAYFAAMGVNGRARLLLIEAPAVLGRDAADELNQRAGGAELRVGLATLLGSSGGDDEEIAALAAVISAAFDRAALDIVNGAQIKSYRAAINRVLTGLRDQH